MKKILLPIVSILALFSVTSCNDFLEVTPLTKISGDLLTSSEGGIMTLLAKMYNITPMEDFQYRPARSGYHYTDWYGNQDTIVMDMYSELACASTGTGVTHGAGFWADYYSNLRQVYTFIETVDKAKENGAITAEAAERYTAEAHFVIAYIYVALATRYGGCPIVDHLLDHDYIPGDANEALFIPRATEKDTWQFILDECDKAAAGLPATVNDYRATKWSALGLKSRAALYAASLAYYNDRYEMAGEAVSKGYVGISKSDANTFFNACISASEQIIKNSGKSLYGANPASVDDAVKNYQAIFETPEQASCEVLFSRAYLDGTVYSGQGHCYDIFYSPSQKHPGFHKAGRYSITLDLVDLYEDYTDDGTGSHRGLKTMNGAEQTFRKVEANEDVATADFIKYDNVTDIFDGIDARFFATVVYPGSTYAGQEITIQGGMFKTDGKPYIYQGESETVGGVTYYAFGGQALGVNYSGFDGAGKNADQCLVTSTGFSLRKFLSEHNMPAGVQASSKQSFIDIRLAEIYLNYAEAVATSGQGDATLAAKCLNDIRHRAAHKDNIPLTVDNVIKERKIELFGEGRAYWDEVRRRESHLMWTNTMRHVLIPMVDLRGGSPKYVFVRANQIDDETAAGRLFQPVNYYLSIPGINVSGLTQNPGLE